jgi:tetratricopeptide (TPR) repeat protein
MRNILRGLFAAVLVPTLAGASVVALEAARVYPDLDGPPVLDASAPTDAYALAAWCDYLGGTDTRELLARLDEGPSPAEGDAACALAELRGLLHQGLGEYAEAFRGFARLVEMQPDRPESLVYLRRLVEIAGEFPGGEAELEALCRRLVDDASAEPALETEARRILVDIHRAAGFPDGAVEATRLTHDLGYLRFFSYLGPFDNTGEAGFDTPYGPEVDSRVDLSARYAGKRTEVGWRAFPQPAFALTTDPGLPPGWGGAGSISPFYGPLQLSAVTRPNNQVCGFLATWVRVGERTEVVLNLGAVGSFRLWVDGAEVLSFEGYRSWAHPDSDRGGVVLEPGWHEVLVKTCCDVGGWEVYLRTTDRAGGPLPLEHRAEPPPGWRRPSAGPETFEPGPDPYARLQELGDSGNVLGLYYLGHLEAGERRADVDSHLHREFFSRAAELSRSFARADGRENLPWAPAAYSYALAEEKFNPAKLALTEALEADPHHVESYVALADAYSGLGRPDEVTAYAGRGLRENPDCLELLHLEAVQLGVREYQLERRRTLDRMAELHPDYGPLLEELAAYSQNRLGVDERVGIYSRMLELDAGDESALGHLADLYVDAGRPGRAEELLERARPLLPYSLWLYQNEARLLYDRGDYAGTSRVLDGALAICPEEAELLALKACSDYETGKTSEAEEEWARALVVQPNLTWVSDYTRTLAATAEDGGETRPAPFDEPYAYDVYSLADAFAPLDPDASAEVLLDQEIVKVKSDGTASRVVHRVIVLKTEDALEDFGWGYFSYVPNEQTYEVRHVRVIRRDGTELEASDWREYSASDPEARMYSGSVMRYAPLPGIEPGAVIDIEYQIDDVGENIYQGHFSDTFVFGNYQPTHIAEYVVIAPKTLLHYHGANSAPAPEVETKDQERVWRWTLHDIGRIIEEPSAVPLIEVLPFVVVSSFDDWRALGRWWWQLSKDTLAPTPRIRELADEIVADAGARTTFEKITAVYDYVTRKLRYVAILLGIGGWRPIEPESTVQTGYGDCKASAALMVSLYRALGIEAYPVLVRTRDRGAIKWDQAALGLFNHMICAVPFQEGFGLDDVHTKLTIPGDEFGSLLYLDGTTDFSTWWELPSGDQGVTVYVCTPDGGYFADTPFYPADDNFIYSRTRFVLDTEGNAVGHRELDYGARLSPERRADNQQTEMQETDLEVYWNRRYPGTDVYAVNISDVTDMDDNVHYSYDLRVPSLARREASPTGDTLVFATHVHQDLLAQRYGSLTERTLPLRFDYRWLQNTRTVYVLPPDYVALSLPEPQSLTLTTGDGAPLASMYVTYDYDGAPSAGEVQPTLTVSDELRIDAGEVSVEDYPAFRSFLAAYERVQSQVVVFARSGDGD